MPVKRSTAVLKFLTALAIVGLCARPCWAWFDAGHMIVAYIAYQKLDPQIQKRVDVLMKLNPMYKTWTKGVASKRKGVVAFVNAATWPDCIKDAQRCPGFQNVGGDIPPGNPTDGQNIGYKDKLMHKYWHYVDHPISAGAPGLDPPAPNAETQIQLFAEAIGSNKSDNIKSYDIVWLEHIIGDIHQPLHAAARYTQNHPKGDAGGNFVTFCKKPCRDELHAFWDGLPGDRPSFDEVAQKGQELLGRPKPHGADSLEVTAWTLASFDLAKTAVYVSPIGSDNDPNDPISPRPDAPYQQNAMSIANSQVLLGGYRLAAILNAKLK